MGHLPHSNGRLTKITRNPEVDDWEGTTVEGPAVWEGDCDCYVRDTTRQEVNDGRTDRVTVRLVTVPAEVAVSVGDTLHITWRDAALVVPVTAVTVHEAPAGVPGESVAEVEPT